MNKDEETILAIDYGESNIGTAFGRNGLVMPLEVIDGTNSMEAIRQICRMAIENKITKVIMGLPLTADNRETKKSHVVRRFTKLLKAKLNKPVIFVNEYSTSKDAIKDSISMGMKQKSRKKIDHLSAALILKKYYNS